MAVICLLRRASDDWISHLAQMGDLGEVQRLALAPEETQEVVSPPKRPMGFWARLTGRSGKMPMEGPPAEDMLDLYKCWHGLHFLMTGRDYGGDWPLSFLYGGGSAPAGDDSSPVRLLTAEQVGEVATALSHVDVVDLHTNFNPAEMEGQCIYPGGWEVEPEEELFQFLQERFEETKQFVAATAEQGRGLVIYVG